MKHLSYFHNLKPQLMKILTLLALALPLCVIAQNPKHHEDAMKRFQKFYNAGQGDSVNAMFGHGWDKMKSTRPIWTNDENARYLKKVGYLKSFSFIGIDTLDPEKVYVFRTVFSKAGVKNSSLTLESDNMLGTFRLITTPDGLLKTSKPRKGK